MKCKGCQKQKKADNCKNCKIEFEEKFKKLKIESQEKIKKNYDNLNELLLIAQGTINISILERKIQRMINDV